MFSNTSVATRTFAETFPAQKCVPSFLCLRSSLAWEVLRARSGILRKETKLATEPWVLVQFEQKHPVIEKTSDPIYLVATLVFENISSKLIFKISGFLVKGCVKGQISWKFSCRYVMSSSVFRERLMKHIPSDHKPAPGPGRSSRVRADSGPGIEEFHFTHMERGT